MSQHQEIQNLELLMFSFKISIEVLKQTEKQEDLVAVIFRVGNNKFKIYIQDEYNDLDIPNPILHLCLVLRELELYEESTDYIQWTRFQAIPQDNRTLIAYYRELSATFEEIKSTLGKIDSYINDLDFQLNAGAAQNLRSISN